MEGGSGAKPAARELAFGKRSPFSFPTVFHRRYLAGFQAGCSLVVAAMAEWQGVGEKKKNSKPNKEFAEMD